MKILCVIDSLGSGGAQRQLVSLAIGFKEKGHNVFFLTYHPENFFEAQLKKKNIPVNCIEEPNYLLRLLKMRRFIRTGNYDSVLSFLEASNFICEIAGFPNRKWRLVVGERSANPRILKSFKLRGFRFFHFLADHIVANSYENIKLIKKANPFIRSGKYSVIYNLIDFKLWYPDKKNYIFRRNNKLNLVVVASHQYLKNVNGLIEAVNQLSSNEKNQLIIKWFGGKRNDDSRLEALKKIKKYGLENVFKFYNPTLNINKEINGADALGLFSFYEGFPNVVCEGMALAKPVISSKVSDISLLIKSPQCLFNPHNIDEIKDTISYVLSLSEKELINIGEANRQAALAKFDKELIIREYLKLLN